MVVLVLLRSTFLLTAFTMRLFSIIAVSCSTAVSCFIVQSPHSVHLSRSSVVQARPKKSDSLSDDVPPKSSGVPNEMDPAKRAALNGVLNQIERSYGRGSVVKLGDAEGM